LPATSSPPTRHQRALDVRGAAHYLGVSPRQIRRWVAMGAIPFTKMGPRALRFYPDELDAWVDARTHRPSDEPEAA
jgi:excisionase family DNA binding protein